MADRYWVGGSGTWNSTDTTHWSATNGGTGGASVPGSQDMVWFNANSGGGGTVLLSGTLSALAVDLNGFTGTINLGSSTLNLTASNYDGRRWDAGSSAAISRGTSTINCAALFIGGGKSYYNVNITGELTFSGIYDGNSFVNLSFTNGKVGLPYGDTTTVTGTFTASNVTIVGGGGSTSTISASTRSLTNANFKNITAAGSNLPFTGESLGDLGGNTNITFPTPSTRYAVPSATPNWNSTSMWSTTSGGTPGASVPGVRDTAIFDANSTGSYTIDRYAIGTIQLSSFAGTISINSIPVTIYGDVTLTSNFPSSFQSRSLTFNGDAKTPILINANGFGLNVSNVEIDFATVQLSSALDIRNAALSIKSYTTFNTNNNNLDVKSVAWGTSYVNNISLGTSTVSVWGTGTIWNVSTTSTTFSAENCSIILANSTTSSRTFNGQGKTYGSLTIGGNTAISTTTFLGANTFTNFSNTKTVANTITFESGKTTNIANWDVTGSSGNVVTINSTTSTQHTLNYTGAKSYISSNFFNIQNSAATPSSKWFAGVNSVNSGNNTGWLFANPPSGSLFFGSHF